MDPLGLHEFAAVIDGTAVAGAHADVVIRHVTTHSDRIHSGSAFFALTGSRTDGHRFVPVALENGAVAAVVSRGRAGSAAGGPLVEVDDPLLALQRLAAWWRSQITATVVAVVGSNGKTITKDAMVHFLGYGMSVHGSPGSYNSELGVPLAILACPKECDIAVIEVAVSNPGEMAAMERILRPDRVVLTNLGTRWQSRFRDRPHLAEELVAMANHVGPEGWLLLGQESEELTGAASSHTSCDLLLSNRSRVLPAFSSPRHDPQGLLVRASFPDGPAGTVCVRTPSEEILADVEVAMSASYLLGVGGTTLLSAAEEYVPTATRTETWRSPAGVTVVRDVATPDPIAMSSAIRSARGAGGSRGRTVVVLAQPLVRWDDATAPGLARALVAEKVDEVFGLEVDTHRAVAVATAQLEPRLPVRLFESTADLQRHLLGHLRPGDVALVQSPPETSISDVATALMEAMAPTRLYLDVSAVEDNVRTFRRIVGPSVRIMGMVKALAYGTDAVSVSLCLQDAGVDFLGVSGVDEGAVLRRAGVNLPVLVLLGTGSELDKMLRYRLTPLVYSPGMLGAVLATASKVDRPFAVHLEVDTGMHRTGFEPEQAIEVVERLLAQDNVVIEGLMTHLACADNPAEDGFTREQLARFERVVRAARSLGVGDVIRHAAATAATIRLPEAHFDMVRIGLGLYGMQPSAATGAAVELEPALGLQSRIVEIIDVPAGERVGYGGTYTAPAGGGRIGVVPAGYHDCVPRALSNFGYVIVAGIRCPIVGTISMDSMTIDLSRCPEAHVDADVLIYGRHNDWLIRLEEVSATIGTIPYEVMSRVGSRVQRILSRH